MNIFVLDDMRNIKSALGAVGLSSLITDDNIICLCRPSKTSFEGKDFDSKICCSLEPALDIIANNRKFDIWIIDSDLGLNEFGHQVYGYDFLLKVNQGYPDKLPRQLYCCSSNLEQKTAILSLFDKLK